MILLLSTFNGFMSLSLCVFVSLSLCGAIFSSLCSSVATAGELLVAQKQ